MDKKQLSERDICTKYINPALEEAGWDIQKQVREEVPFTAGRVIVRGKMAVRGKSKRADYILYYKPNFPIAIIEAKSNRHTVSDGLEQAINYGNILDIPFVYSSNGDGFVEHDRTAKKKELYPENLLWMSFLHRKYCGKDTENIRNYLMKNLV